MSDAKHPGSPRYVAELLALGDELYLAWGRGPSEGVDTGTAPALRGGAPGDVTVLPAERGRQVLREACRRDRDVRARLLALQLRLEGSALEATGVAVKDRDFERALSWALAKLKVSHAPGVARLYVLQRVRPGISGPFQPIALEVPEKRRESLVPDELSSLEFEVLDNHDDPLAGVPYVVTFPDGETRRGRLSAAGYAFIANVPPGNYNIAFPAAEQPEAEEEADFLDIELVTTEGEPLGGFAYVATFSDGSKWEGVLDENGRAHLAPVPPGAYEVKFPALDAETEGEIGGPLEDDGGELEDADGNDNALEPDDGSPALVADERVDETPGAAFHDDHEAGTAVPASSEEGRSCVPPPQAS